VEYLVEHYHLLDHFFLDILG